MNKVYKQGSSMHGSNAMSKNTFAGNSIINNNILGNNPINDNNLIDDNFVNLPDQNAADQNLANNAVVEKIPPFAPIDASSEMIGRKFVLDEDVEANITVMNKSKVKVTIPKGQIVKAETWDNDKNHIKVSTYYHKNIEFNVSKTVLTPLRDLKSGLDQYSSGIDPVKKEIKSTETKIENWESDANYELYKKNNNLKTFHDQLQQYDDAQVKRYKDLNEKLIQEAMYNNFDASIVKWVAYYNEKFKYAELLDPNLVKSMMFQESGMGTSGQHLNKSERFYGDPKTRFNLLQAVDSSGVNLTLMMTEMDPKLAETYKLSEIRSNLEKDKKIRTELANKKKLTEDEQKQLTYLNTRSVDGKHWDHYYWTDTNFRAAWDKFIEQTSPRRNNDYDFWIQTGVRWLFEKRKSVASWDEAVRAYNGTGDKAINYKKNVITRRNKAKEATKNNHTLFFPKIQY